MTDKEHHGPAPDTGGEDSHADVADPTDDRSRKAGSDVPDESASSESPAFDDEVDDPFEVATDTDDSAVMAANVLDDTTASGSASHETSEDIGKPDDDAPTRIIDMSQLVGAQAAATIGVNAGDDQTVVDYRPKPRRPPLDGAASELSQTMVDYRPKPRGPPPDGAASDPARTMVDYHPKPRGPPPDGAASDPAQDEWAALDTRLDFKGTDAAGPSLMAVGDGGESKPAQLHQGDASGRRAAATGPRITDEQHPYRTPVVLICAAATIIIILAVIALWPIEQATRQTAQAPAPPTQEGTNGSGPKPEAAVVAPFAARPATEQSSAEPDPSRAAAEPKSVQQPAAPVGKSAEPAPRPQEVERSPPDVTRMPKATPADRPPPSRERRRKPRRVKDDSRAGKRPKAKGNLDSLFDKFESSPQK